MEDRGSDRPSTATAARYALFQLPGIFIAGAVLLSARHWFGLPGWALWTLFAFWIAKDIILFPLTWRSYSLCRTGTADMSGEQGVALEALEPQGKVRVRGEIWNAELASGFAKLSENEEVYVSSMKGLTLIVRPSPENRR